MTNKFRVGVELNNNNFGNQNLINTLKQQGASAVVVSWQRIENYSAFPDGTTKENLKKVLLNPKNKNSKQTKHKENYIIKID